jgi:CHAD domain-containing protein
MDELANELAGDLEHWVEHDYDTVDRDLERLGIIVSRLPSEAGIIWRLRLHRGERVEAWEPGTSGLAPPAEIMEFIGGVLGGKQLVPAPPLGNDPGVLRLRAMLGKQRSRLLAHDPGVRLGDDHENLHQHRVAARRSRALLRAARTYLDPDWRRSLADALGALGTATGPARDLDVLLEHVQAEQRGLDDADQGGAAALVASIDRAREAAHHQLLGALHDERYRLLLARLHLPPRLRADVNSIPLERIARTEFRRLARAVDRLGKQPTDAAMHGLRISLKRARYAAELSTPSGATGRRFLEDAKRLQELLGEHQDAVAAEQLLRTTAVVDTPTAAAFVAGRLAERQVGRRARVQQRFPGAWRRLRKRAAQLN